MSYNTRRGAGGNTVTNVGTRRSPMVTNNFISAGTLTPQKPGIQMPQQQQQQQQQAGVQQGQQQKPVATQRPGFSSQPPQNQQQNFQKNPPLPQQPPLPPQPKPNVQNVQAQQNALHLKTEKLEESQSMEAEVIGENGEEQPKKRFFNRGGPKVSKKERLRRRNVRLSRILQPKNALMILNEIAGNPAFTIVECNDMHTGVYYRATVTIDGIEHQGTAKAKVSSKAAAAENALRFITRNKSFNVKNDDGSEVMETGEDQPGGEEGAEPAGTMPWQHLASFALFKLFASWGENPTLSAAAGAGPNAAASAPKDHRPAKKLPENAADMNPQMLLNQMLPNAQYEELPKLGSPPKAIFQIKCVVNGQSFTGYGPNKKVAKRMAAFGACRSVLEINYPPDVYTPQPPPQLV